MENGSPPPSQKDCPRMACEFLSFAYVLLITLSVCLCYEYIKSENNIFASVTILINATSAVIISFLVLYICLTEYDSYLCCKKGLKYSLMFKIAIQLTSSLALIYMYSTDAEGNNREYIFWFGIIYTVEIILIPSTVVPAYVFLYPREIQIYQEELSGELKISSAGEISNQNVSRQKIQNNTNTEFQGIVNSQTTATELHIKPNIHNFQREGRIVPKLLGLSALNMLESDINQPKYYPKYRGKEFKKRANTFLDQINEERVYKNEHKNKYIDNVDKPYNTWEQPISKPNEEYIELSNNMYNKKVTESEDLGMTNEGKLVIPKIDLSKLGIHNRSKGHEN